MASILALPLGVSQPRLVHDFSLEMTAKDIEQLELAAAALPAGTQVSITFLPNENFPGRVCAAAAVKQAGLVPMPHISARRIASRVELEMFLDRLASDVGIDRAFVVAGDPAHAAGPFDDALAVIRSGLLAKYGVKHLGIAGYPEGHPQIGDATLWQALRDKHRVLTDMCLDYSIMTQFGFDADPIFGWLEKLRAEGIMAPVRLGVAGPASVKTLLRFAARCGVGASAKVVSKYGLAMTRLLGTVGPDRIIADLAAGLDHDRHGIVKLHYYPFGGLLRTAEWARDYAARHGG